MSRRISRAARRYLLTGNLEKPAQRHGFSGGRWAAEPLHHSDAMTVHHFRSEADRHAFMRNRPKMRAVGKRSPWVKAFRATMFPDCAAAIVSRFDAWRVTGSAPR